MFAKLVWYLPAALLVFFLLYSSIGLWFSEWVAIGYEQRREGGIYEVLSPDTVDAIQDDKRLQHALLSLTEMVASKSEALGEQVGSDGLKEFGQRLTMELAKLRNVQPQRRKRELLEGLGNTITGSGASRNKQQAQGQSGGMLSGIADAFGLGGAVGNDTAGLAGIRQEGLSSFGDSILGDLATPALFLGIGIGMGTETGLNLTDKQNSQDMASKVAAAFNAQPTGINHIAQNLGIGLSAQIAPSLGNIPGAQLGMAAFALAQGIGQGSASGLNLTQQQIQPSNGTDIMSIAGNFGLGVSQPIASNINVKQLLSGAGASGGQLMAQLPQIAAAAGQGLGEGASAGLGFSKNSSSLQRRQSTDPNSVDILGTTSDLTKVANVIAPGASSGLGSIDFMGMILPIASGAGKGIGEGAAIGLGFQVDAGFGVMPANATANQSTEMIVSEFAKGLVAIFLANGTASVALSNLTAGAGGLTAGAQGSKVAEGLARGLVEGSVNAISMVGGINNVLSVTSTSLSRRQDAPTSSPSLAINANMLSSLAQAGTNALTCQGFGGIAFIALGLKNGGAMKTDGQGSVPLGNQKLAALPKDPIVITSEGNRFSIKIQDGEVRINDLALLPFAILTALHVVLTTFAFFFALPAYLALGAILRLSVMIGYPLKEAKNTKWRRLILLALFLPSSIVGIILGIVGIGKASHFRDAHSFVGLLTFLLIILTVVTSFLRLRSTAIVPSSAFAGIKAIPRTFKSPARMHLIAAFLQQVILQFATLTWIQGFSTLHSITLCVVDAVLTAPVVVGLMTAILFTQVGAMSVVGLRMWLEQRIRKKSSLSQEESGVVVVVEKGGMKRSDTMKTFGFEALERSSPSPPLIRPKLKERNTTQLLGREDSKTGWPSQVRKFSDEDARQNDNPFLDPRDPRPEQQDRVYDEKLGGFVLSPTHPAQYNAYKPQESRPSYGSRSSYPDFVMERRSRDYLETLPNTPVVQRKPVAGDGEERADSGVLLQRFESFSRLRRERASGPEEEDIRVGWPSYVPQREDHR
ncbi:hypothetical protein BDV96DRAFT_636494 [Lophiotrema nucula]|uniref:Cytochrome b561 domain-containing protein n=1 Tax=Lophiotrema nucula TaxID=690887 RepID=A0A6A5YPZ1_9PLEO|nr:hypothetical protein BDV96DRAFT_636494 [Lophiotrema nucula]